MVDTFELDGTEYEMTGDPSLRTVRHVQSMQMNMIMQYVDEDDLREMDSIEDESEIINAIIDSGGYSALQDVMWEKSMLEAVQTISLAVDEVLAIDDIEELPAREFKSVREDAEEALEGDATDFFDQLGIGLSLDRESMEREAAKQQSET